MPTVKQRRVAKLIIENTALDKPLNGGEMLEKVGYAKGLIKTPSRILESEGVREALAEAGFTEENAKSVVAEILLNPDADDGHRLKAAEQVFKVTGAYAPEKRLTASVDLTPKSDTEEQLEALRQEYVRRLKETFSQ